MQYAKLVEHWIVFFIATPKEAEACWKELRTIIAKASRAVNGKPHTTYSLNEQKDGRALLKKQINRLQPNFRLQLRTLKTKEKARRIAAMVLPKPLKKMIRTMIYNARQQ